MNPNRDEQDPPIEGELIDPREDFFSGLGAAPGDSRMPVSPVDHGSQVNQLIERVQIVDFFQRLHQYTPQTFVTRALITINIVVFAAFVLIGGASLMMPEIDVLTRFGANRPSLTTSGEWWRLLSCMFLHVGLIHLLVNMYALKALGPFVERLVGNPGYVVIYFFSGLMGSLASVAWNPVSVSAGASGAIFGVFGVLVAVLIRCRHTMPPKLVTSLQKNVIIMLGINLALGFSIEAIDMAAHIGGLIAGFFCALFLIRPITQASFESRARRAAIVGVFSAIAVAGSIYAAPKNLPDFPSELEKFHLQNDKIVHRFDDIIQGWQKGQIKDVALADEIDKELLPAIRSERERLEQFHGLRGTAREMIDDLLVYSRTRESSWEKMSEALRTNDPATMREAIELQKQANDQYETFLKEYMRQ